MKKARIWSTLGLIFITVLSAIQYIFLRNVPDSVSTFAFLCITNLLGFAILGATQLKKLFTVKRKTVLKGMLAALELTGFNFFLLLGSRNMDSVIISSVVSMYFVFITPLLLLCRKKVNFLSAIASVIAIIALLLMFGADTDALFSSFDVFYLLAADLFFAAYVVTISLMGGNEDSVQLTLTQMLFAVVFALAGWFIESRMGHGTFALPTDKRFWISACFIGIAIRAVYGLIQIAAQKHVPAINASLIFSSEIIITLILNPLLCKLFGTEYMPATVYNIVGCVLFLIATLLVDETFMAKLGFGDLEAEPLVDENGKTIRQSSVSKKMVVTTLSFALITLILTSVVSLTAIHFIRSSAVDNSTKLGDNASTVSSEALTDELESEMLRQTDDKAALAESRLRAYSVSTVYAGSYATSLYADPANYPDREVAVPDPANKGSWVMQRTLASEDIDYADLEAESRLLGNMADIFGTVVENNNAIATVYMGTESGLLISYDRNSDVEAAENGENYYEYRGSEWYEMAKNCDGYAFTAPYVDSYGRGLTITCVAPFYQPDGSFYGCVAMDILVDDLNNSLVNDGIVEPSVASMIDADGKVIAGKYLNESGDDVYITKNFPGNNLFPVANMILKKNNGLSVTGKDDGAVYIAYATVESTGWTLCIESPISHIIAPAKEIRDSINENTGNVVSSVEQGIKQIVEDCLILSAVILLLATFLTGRISRRISDPLKKLEEDVRTISRGELDYRTQVKTNDEIGSLASSFNSMTDSIQKYMVDLKEITSKEERIATELAFATKIQADMLPCEFPAFPGRTEFDIYATMTPAKEIGGDFYDYFLLDDDHIALVIADVSGKGVPAALFMMMAKTLIKTRAQMGGTPAEILHDVNEQLLENDKAELFVTVWFAIVDLTTGEGVETNAGHEHPALRHKDGAFELVKTKHSPAVSVMNGIRFKQNEFKLEPGDRLFVYTDGAPEATNAENEMFGGERLIDSLNRRSGGDITELLTGLKRDIDEFVGEAPQFDDVTMLCFDFFGKQTNE